jgi:heme exporter protein CcmD
MNMGQYGAYIVPAYAVSALVIAALAAAKVAAYRRLRTAIEELERSGVHRRSRGKDHGAS